MTVASITMEEVATDLWTPEAVKAAYAEALVVLERSVERQGPRMAKPSLQAIYTPEDILGQSDRFDKLGQLMPNRETRFRVRYSAEQIEWATFVLCGGSFHGSAKLEPWTSGIIGSSVTRSSFEAWGKQVATRRLGGRKLAMAEVAITVGLPLRTFTRYVTGAAEQIAKALNRAGVEMRG